MKIYISNYLSKSISVLDYPMFKFQQDIILDENIYPHHICIDKDKDLMYIPSSSNGILYILNLVTNEIIENVSIGGNLSQIGMCKDELFVSNEDTNSIYILDKKTLNPVCIIAVDEMPHGFDFNLEDNLLYVPCINSILCIDTINKSIIRKKEIGFKSWHIKVDRVKNEIYISTLDGKVVILDRKMDVIKIVDEFLLPVEICFNYTLGRVYVADLGYRSIKVLDYETGNYIDEIKVDGNPQGLKVSPDEKILMVSDTQKNCLKIYDTEKHTLIKEVKVGKEPTTILCL